MKIPTSTPKTYMLKLTEEEMIWLHDLMQNLISEHEEYIRSGWAGSPHDTAMRKTFFNATDLRKPLP